MRLQGVPWPSDVTYTDNQACIDCLQRPQTGVLRLLDEACGLKGGEEANWFRRVGVVHTQGKGQGPKGASSFVASAEKRHKLRDRMVKVAVLARQ